MIVWKFMRISWEFQVNFLNQAESLILESDISLNFMVMHIGNEGTSFRE